MKKRLLASLLILAMLCAFGLTACNNNQNTGSTAGSQGLAYEKSEDGKTCTITGIGTCTDTFITIPGSIDGATVTIIGVGAFKGNKDITDVVVTTGVTEIKQNAFAGCSSMKSITLPASVKYVRGSAFEDCSVLSKIYYEGVKKEFAAIDVKEKNEKFESATVYYYSDVRPADSGKYWHDVDGVPTAW